MELHGCGRSDSLSGPTIEEQVRKILRALLEERSIEILGSDPGVGEKLGKQAL
jgi:hypothetical protein